MRIIVISDIHANYSALREALKLADKKGFDFVVFLGDLLTYGVDVEETISTVYDRLSVHNSVLIRGNHDVIYDSFLSNNESEYFISLPAWIAESVRFTLEKLVLVKWKELCFINDYSMSGIYFSHANPFGPGDWRYLTGDYLFEQAAKQLRNTNHSIGVFGHTHRTSIYESNGSICGFVTDILSATHISGYISILNPGSVGQPRSKGNSMSSLLIIDVTENTNDGIVTNEYRYSFQFFGYQIDKYFKSINDSSLSDFAKSKILSYMQ